MAIIEVERTETAIPLSVVVDKNGGVTGLTATVAIIDPTTLAAATPSYYDFSDGAFKSSAWTTRQQTCIEVDASLSPGLYALSGGFDLSAATGLSGSANQLIVEYEISGSEQGVTNDLLILKDEAYSVANQTTLAAVDSNVNSVLIDTDATIPALLGTIDGNVDSILTDTGTTLPASLATIDGNVDSILTDTGTILPGTLATIDTNVDSVLADTAAMQPQIATGVTAWLTATGFAVPGDAMDLVTDAVDAAAVATNAIDAAALATDAVTEIRNSILSDGTPFLGASIAAILADTGTDIPARFDGIEGAGFVTGTDSLEAIRDQGDAAWTTGAGSSPTATADAVWDAVATSYNDAGSMGELLNGAGGAFTPAQVADAVWDEAVADHLGAGAAGAHMADILADTANIDTTVTSNLDSPVSSRAVAGDTMDIGSIAANAITAASMAADASAEISTQVAADLASVHGGGAWGTATGFAVPGDAMTLTAAQESDLIDSMWDEPQAAHVQAGSTGESLDDASAGGAGLTQQQVRDSLQLAPTTPPISSPNATGIDRMIWDGRGDTFDKATDALETLRDRGDAAWITGGTGNPILAYFGYIYIDLANGTPGTSVGTHGTADKPANNLANAVTLAAATGIRAYRIRNGTINLGAAHDNWTFEGYSGATVSLNGQSVAGSTFRNVTVAGTAGGTGDVRMDDCVLSTVSGLSGSLHNCLIRGVLTFRAGANVDLFNCRNLGDNIDVNGGRVRWAGHVGHTGIINATDGGKSQLIYSEGGLIETYASDTAGVLSVTGPAFLSRDDAMTSGVIQLTNPETVSTQVDVDLSAAHTPGSWAGGAIPTSQDIRDALLLSATGGEDAIDTKLNDLETQVGTRATQASVDTVDGIVDSILADTAAIDTITAATLDAAVTTRAVAGDEMALTAAEHSLLVDEVWDESNAAHVAGGSMGESQLASGGGTTPSQIADAVWDADQLAHVIAGSMGKAMADGGDIPQELESVLNRYLTAVRKYGPVAVQQPLAVKDEISAGDIGAIITVPLVLDGSFVDLADATSITFNFTSPVSPTVIAKPGIGVTTATGSYTSFNSDSDLFDVAGRWRVQVVVLWPDTTTKASLMYSIDVQPPLPVI